MKISRLMPFLISFAAAASSGCGGTQSAMEVPNAAQNARSYDARMKHTAHTTQSPITHLIVVMQQQRSFNDIFAGFRGADAPTAGCASGGTAIRAMGSSSQCPPGDTLVPLSSVGMSSAPGRAEWRAVRT
jgi:phospholipase C